MLLAVVVSRRPANSTMLDVVTVLPPIVAAWPA
jgi:hypothetical protein